MIVCTYRKNNVLSGFHQESYTGGGNFGHVCVCLYKNVKLAFGLAYSKKHRIYRRTLKKCTEKKIEKQHKSSYNFWGLYAKTKKFINAAWLLVDLKYRNAMENDKVLAEVLGIVCLYKKKDLSSGGQ